MIPRAKLAATVCLMLHDQGRVMLGGKGTGVSLRSHGRQPGVGQARSTNARTSRSRSSGPRIPHPLEKKEPKNE